MTTLENSDSPVSIDDSVLLTSLVSDLASPLKPKKEKVTKPSDEDKPAEDKKVDAKNNELKKSLK
jgi:hypothetical protein